MPLYVIYFFYQGCAKSIFNAGWNLHVRVDVCVWFFFPCPCEVLALFFPSSQSVLNIFVHTFTWICSYVRLHVCICVFVYMWHTTVLSAWLNIFPVHSPLLLSLSLPPLPPSPPPLPPTPNSPSLRLAGTYMHVCRLCTVLAAVACANLTAMQPCVH